VKLTQEQLDELLKRPGVSLEWGKEAFVRQKGVKIAFYDSPANKFPLRFDNKTCEILKDEIKPPNFTIHKTSDEEKLNKTEKAYLAHLRMLGYKDVGVQNITLKLGADCRLTVDFNFIDESQRFHFVDTKAFSKKRNSILCEDDARAKMAVAARLFRWATFSYAYQVNGKWTEQEVKP